MKIKYLSLMILGFGLIGCGQKSEPDLLVVCGGAISDAHINFDFKNNLVTERIFYKPFYLEAVKATGNLEPSKTREYPIEEYTNSFIEYGGGSATSLKISMIFDRASMTKKTETAYYNFDGSLREPIGDLPNPMYITENCTKPVV